MHIGRSYIAALMLLWILSVCTLALPLASAATRTEHDYHNDPFTYLLFSFLMSFALICILLGAFAFRFGKKRTRSFSVPMMIGGVVIWGIWAYFNLIASSEYPDDTVLGIIHWVAAPLLKPIMAVLGVAAGFGLGLLIFLNTIVRP
ncbi:MAG: hypothetical protein QCI82_11190 [Candidatus Thermoplasmatota archaeon]|nr:hypothetical protein [Candidatus Thermoplasmatota archaeon]